MSISLRLLKRWLDAPTVNEPKSAPLSSLQTSESEQPDTTAPQLASPVVKPVLDVQVTLPLVVTMTLDLDSAWRYTQKLMPFSTAIGQIFQGRRSTSHANPATRAGSSSQAQVLREFGGRKVR